MSSNTKLAKELLRALEQRQKRKTTAIDTLAEVKRVEGDTIWVHVPGGPDETPIRKTISAKPGDKVQIRIAGGRGWVSGNETSPPTDDTLAKAANQTAGKAKAVAEAAKVEAGDAAEVSLEARGSALRAYDAGTAQRRIFYAYAADTSGGSFSLTDTSLPYRGICVSTDSEAPSEPEEYVWEINPLWASKQADNYLHELTDGLAIYNSNLDTTTYAGISALALTFYLAGVMQMKVGYDAALEQYGVIAESILAAGNGAGVKFDNTSEASARGRFVWEVRDNGHLSLKLY